MERFFAELEAVGRSGTLLLDPATRLKDVSYTPPEEDSPHHSDSPQEIQGEFTRAYLGKKHQHSVGLQVLVDRETRNDINAIAAVHDVSTKDYIAGLIRQDVAKNHFLIPQGQKILAQRKKRPYHSRLQAVEEENLRLRQALQKKSSSPSR